MASQAQATKNKITLKGSAKIVTEFFHYSVNRCARFIKLNMYLCRSLSTGR